MCKPKNWEIKYTTIYYQNNSYNWFSIEYKLGRGHSLPYWPLTPVFTTCPSFLLHQLHLINSYLPLRAPSSYTILIPQHSPTMVLLILFLHPLSPLHPVTYFPLFKSLTITTNWAFFIQISLRFFFSKYSFKA
jgi:hypothetical protein